MDRPVREPLGLHLTRVSRTISRAFDDALAEAGGSLPVWLVLISLKRGQLASQRELAEAVGVQGATLSHHLNAMESAGLVTRRRDPRNRRLHLVEPTPEGDALFSRLREVSFAFDQRLRAGLTEHDVDQFESLLTRLHDNVTKHQPDGMPVRSVLGGPELGQVDAEPVPQAGLAGLGHGDDTAGLPGGDPAALRERGREGCA
jgi:MarR family transcriptional regulator for hemolysin